jgi:hypothetical protein
MTSVVDIPSAVNGHNPTQDVEDTNSERYLIYLDLGASLTKGFFFGRDGQACPLAINSLVSQPLFPSQLEGAKELMVGTPIDDSIWVRLSDGQVRAVGKFAVNFAGEPWLNEQKHHQAIFKVLSAIGIMKTRLGIPIDQSISISLGILLPFSEFQSKTEVSAVLRHEIENGCEFRDTPLKIEIDQFQFYPEGVGLSLNQMRVVSLRGQNYRYTRFVVVMLGFRNASVLVFDGNTFQPGKSSSTGPGFSDALSSAMSSGTRAFQKSDEDKVLGALRGGSPSVLLSGEKRRVDISDVVQLGLSSYWGRLEGFLRSQISLHYADQCELVIGGGVVSNPFIRERLVQFLESLEFNPATSFAEHDPALAKIFQASDYKDSPECSPDRFVDVYSSFMNFCYKL